MQLACKENMKQNIVVKEDIWEPGKRILNDYIIVKSLGRGGAGQVFLVKRISTGQLFAIKTITSHKIAKIFSILRGSRTT